MAGLVEVTCIGDYRRIADGPSRGLVCELSARNWRVPLQASVGSSLPGVEGVGVGLATDGVGLAVGVYGGAEPAQLGDSLVAPLGAVPKGRPCVCSCGGLCCANVRGDDARIDGVGPLAVIDDSAARADQRWAA